jgi:sugar O-acyltransferase (sialic acid O-acetyltransferase NeuD family)
MKNIVIFGIGGHSKVVCDILVKQNKYRPIAFVSLNESISIFMGIPHVHQSKFADIACELGIIAIGDNFIRNQVSEFILSKKPHFNFISAIHPSAQIADGVKIGEGSVVMALSALNSDTVVKRHVIINTHSSVDHDGLIGDFASIAPGCALGGNVEVGSFSAVSLGAQVIHNIKIGEHSVIGAGALVLNDIGDFKVAYGIPCKEMRDRIKGEKYL